MSVSVFLLLTLVHFSSAVNSSEIDRTASIPPEILERVKKLGLYGMQIPQEYGGLGLGATEYSRLSEIIALDGGIGVTVSAHQAIGFKVTKNMWLVTIDLNFSGFEVFR